MLCCAMKQIETLGLRENVKAFVFGNTASNAGARRGATVRLVQELGRPHFFLACRHHISELILKAQWCSIFEVDLRPTYKIFGEVKDD